MAFLLAGLMWPMSAGAAPVSPVYIEDSPAAQEAADEALSLAEQGRRAEAAEALQRVMLEYSHKLMTAGEAVYVDTLLWVRGRLMSEPALLAAYRQVYDAEAARALTEAEAADDAAALESVVWRYALTPSGLEAGLTLAAMYLERADAQSAGSVLDELAEHPDLDQHQARYHELQAVAGLLSGDRARQAHHLDQLRAAGHAVAVGSVEALANRLHPPHRLSRLHSRGGVQIDHLPTDLSEPLWSEPLTWSSVGGDEDERLINRRLRREAAAEVSPPLPIIPAADGQHLYLNEGRRLRALDRSSGWPLWTYEWSAAQGEADHPLLAAARRGGATDERSVLLMGDRALAVMGEAVSQPGRWQPEASPTALVGVDRHTGEPIWSVIPTDLDPALTKAYFMGTPAAGDGRVFALIRRHQVSGFQDTYLVAVDPGSGALQWRRHLSSASTGNRYDAGPPPRMAVHGGMVYACDNLGAIAAVVQRTGTIEWVRLLNDSASPLERAVAQAGGNRTQNVGHPVMVAAGLIVPCWSGSTRQVLLLDPATGQQLRQLSGTAWTTADQFLPAGPDVLAVGAVVTRFDGATLQSRWTHRLGTGVEAAQGRAAVTRDFVAVATGKQLVVLNMADGSVREEIATPSPGHVLVFDEQVIMATADSLRSYISWNRVHEHLTSEMARLPGDPGPGLALAGLAIRAGREAAVLEGVDSALAALRWRDTEAAERSEGSGGKLTSPEASDVAERKVFEHLLAFVTPDPAVAPGSGAADLSDSEAPKPQAQAKMSVALRGELFNRLAQTTAGPAQEVAYHLSIASYLEETSQPAEAVEHLQAVLLDATLAAQLYEQPGVARQAGMEARRRLEKLVAREGAAIYEPYQTRAAHRLAELRAGGADAAALLALAEQYPLAEAASEAMLEAADRLAQSGEPVDAARPLRRAYRQATDASLRARAAGRLAELYVGLGQPQRAVRWLEHVHEQDPTLAPLRQGQPMALDAWVAELSAMDSRASTLPRLTLPLGQPTVLKGRLLTPPAPTSREGAPPPVLVTREGATLRRYALPKGGQALGEQWRAALPFADAEALAVDEEQVLLWSPGERRLLALDGRTGERVWPTVDVAAVLEGLGDTQRRNANRPAQQRRFMRIIEVGPIRVRDGRVVMDQPMPDPGVFATVSEQVVCLVDHVGRVAGVDRVTGEVLWRVMSPMEEVTAVAVERETVALAGVSGLGTGAQSGALLVLDLRTGEPRFPLIEDKESPQWVGFGGEGLVFVATAGQVTAHEADTGAVAWRLAMPAAPLAGPGWADGQLLVLLDNAGVVLAIEARSSEMLNRVSLESFQAAERVRVAAVDHRWHLLSPAGLVTIDAEGQVMWEDAITTPGKSLVDQVVTQGYVAVLNDAGRARAEGEPAEWGGGMAVRANVELDDLEMRRLREAEPAAVFQPPHEAPREDGPHRYELYLLDRETGSLVAEHPLGPLPAAIQPGRAAVVENHLVFPLGDDTLLIPGAGEEGVPSF